MKFEQEISWMMKNIQLDISSRMERHPTLHMPAWLKFSPFLVTVSFWRDFGHCARPIWRRLIISYGDIWKGEFSLIISYGDIWKEEFSLIISYGDILKGEFSLIISYGDIWKGEFSLIISYGDI